MEIINYGKAELQGRRSYMEDITLITNITISDFECKMFSIFDGHGGIKTANYISENIKAELKDFFQRGTSISTAIENAFMSIDEKWRNHQPCLFRDSGTTANICFILEKSYICANLGDCRCILIRNNNVIPLSTDHKPQSERELTRIKKIGSYVLNGRVNGLLGVARAFGDFDFKTSKENPKDNAVTAFPDVIAIAKDPKDQFIIIGSDGLWDVLSNRDVLDCVVDCKNFGKTSSESADILAKKAYASGSKDNISCIVIYL